MVVNVALYKKRRDTLMKLVDGPVLLVGSCENGQEKFCQNSTFYYFTGITEPGALYKHGYSVLFLPRYAMDRSAWMLDSISVDQITADRHGFSAVEYLGQSCKGYSFDAYFNYDQCSNLIAHLLKIVHGQSKLFTQSKSYCVDRLSSMVDGLQSFLVPLDRYSAQLRRTKDQEEIRALFDAIEITVTAQYAAAQAIKAEAHESQVAASVNYVFIENGAREAFPSIIGSGPNSTILHYNQNQRVMKENELVVVDIGARFNYYCGDITRTYPVSGTFTERQKNVYLAVLEAHTVAALHAQPGYWIRNNDNPEKSLHHIALKILQKNGLGDYFVHGIGHFLGLDVHDVGTSSDPLKEGDVITIEPGVYIPEELLGIRLEDNYWIIQDGAICLSESLPKDIQSIEQMMRATI